MILKPLKALRTPPPEDCDPSIWQNPLHPDNDKRCAYLDHPNPTPGEKDLVMASDGSAHPKHGCTYASEARTFGDHGSYHNTTYPIGMPNIGRLPHRFGYEKCTIHTAEVIGALNALHYRKTGSHNLLVVDRSSFFSILKRSFLPTHQRNKGSLAPWELDCTGY